MQLRGIPVQVLRPADTGTAPAPGQERGVSGLHTRLTVTHTVVDELIKPAVVMPVPHKDNSLHLVDDTAPAVWLRHGGFDTRVWTIIPAMPGDLDKAKQDDIDWWSRTWAHSGNYAARLCCDGLRTLMGAGYFYGAVPVHDLVQKANCAAAQRGAAS